MFFLIKYCFLNKYLLRFEKQFSLKKYKNHESIICAQQKKNIKE
jgi:hypothetical protein